MSKFMSGYKINLAKVPVYADFKTDWVTPVDIIVCNLILQSQDERLNPEMKAHFQRTIGCIIDDKLKVSYNNRYKCGRFYPDEPQETYMSNGVVVQNPKYGRYWGNLTIHAGIIKNTIFTYMGWVDYDQVKCHPTILRDVANKNGLKLQAVDEYLSYFDAWCEELISYYSVEGEEQLTTKNIKDLFNLTIYGGGHQGWTNQITWKNLDENEIAALRRKGKYPKKMRNVNNPNDNWKRFKRDIDKITQAVFVSNPDLVAAIKGDLDDDSDQQFSRLRNRTMSYYCGIIENEITYQAYKYGVEKGLFPKKGVDWGFDGFTAPPPPANLDMVVEIQLMTDFVRQATGFPSISFKLKAIDEHKVLYDVLEQRAVTAVGVPIQELVVDGVNLPANLPVEAQAVSTQDAPYVEWKAKFEKEWVKIRNQAIFIRTFKDNEGGFKKFVFMKEKDLIAAYRDDSYIVTDDYGKRKSIKCITKWLDDGDKLCYDDTDIVSPPKICPDNIFNLWSPFPYENKPFEFQAYENPNGSMVNGYPDFIYPPDYDNEAVSAYLQHLFIMCNNEMPVAEYLGNWISHSLQKPAEKPECAITLLGEEGSGKSFLLNGVSGLYGKSKILETSSPERDVWGSFNAPMASSYFVILSETDKRNSKEADGKIKALITDYENPMFINPKGKDQFQIISNHRLFQLTNNNDPTKTHQKDRRNLIIRCSDEKIGDREYFTNLARIMKGVNAMRSIFWYFKWRNIDNWEFRDIPRTNYHKLIIEGNRPALDLFMEHFTWTHINEYSVDLSAEELLTSFTTWRHNNNYTFDEKLSSEALIKRLQTELKLPSGCMECLPRTGVRRSRLYIIPLLIKRYEIDVPIPEYKAAAAPKTVSKPKPKPKPKFKNSKPDNISFKIKEISTDDNSIETETSEPEVETDEDEMDC
jgi:hypothetical protein